MQFLPDEENGIMQKFNLEVLEYNSEEEREDGCQLSDCLRSVMVKWDLDKSQVCMVVVGAETWFREGIKNYFTASGPEVPVMTCFKVCMHRVHQLCEEYLLKEKLIEQTLTILEYFW
jgi:hypothetical protein